MLTFLKIGNIALIDALEIEFGGGLNLLTGETGSGKSIIIDSLGALTGERISSDLIKEGEESAQIQGLFSIRDTPLLRQTLSEGGIEPPDDDDLEIIIRRELSRSGKNRIFINNQLVTRTFLKKVGEFLVDIHGQGEQASLFSPATHLEMLDDFAGAAALRTRTAEAHRHWTVSKTELSMLRQDEAEKLQLLDILKFQVNEIAAASLALGEDERLEEEKRRLNNVEKLSTLSEDAYLLLYESDDSTLTTFDKAAKKITELAEYDTRFAEYLEQITAARAVIEDLGATTRDFRHHLEFSPERLEEIESRLAEITRVIRKYGGTINSALTHLAESQQRLENIETAEFREAELRKVIAERRSEYVRVASDLHEKRTAAARKFEKEVTANLKAVALDKAKFEVHIDSPEKTELENENFDRLLTAKGFDRVEFYFSANPGESPKPLGRVASGGEASRLMLILKTTGKTGEKEKSAVFDEIDAGIGGRVAQAVGQKLKQLAASQQVLCVTHQPQVASLADRHFTIEKRMDKNRTVIAVHELSAGERVEEIAR
ncbi:MAG TPA: DNA repair protein RecN, partial [Pyrinomonadaceae bacterium]|nr:DNA repair protein RecN [Pyrinomonadaceae bacterium]